MIRYFKTNQTFPCGCFRYDEWGITTVESYAVEHGKWKSTHYIDIDDLHHCLKILGRTPIEITEEEASTIVMMRELVS